MIRNLAKVLVLTLALSVAVATFKPAASEAGIVLAVKALKQSPADTSQAGAGGLMAVFGGVMLSYVSKCMAPNAFCAIAGLMFLVLDDRSSTETIAQFSDAIRSEYGASDADAENIAVLMQNAGRTSGINSDSQIVITVSERLLRESTSSEFQATEGFGRLVADLR